MRMRTNLQFVGQKDDYLGYPQLWITPSQNVDNLLVY
jgi:hypothetical protein